MDPVNKILGLHVGFVRVIESTGTPHARGKTLSTYDFKKKYKNFGLTPSDAQRILDMPDGAMTWHMENKFIREE